LSIVIIHEVGEMSPLIDTFEIAWYGHACFKIYNKDMNLSIVFDPYRGIGTITLPPDLRGDIILCTHDHFDHANWNAVATYKSEKFVKLIGDRNIKGIKVRGVLVYHDKAKGSKRGDNAAYVVGYGDGVFIHLGDLGHVLTEEQVHQLTVFGRPHVLFVPVGGVYTIGPEEAIKVIKQLNPHIAIPMHYYMDGLNRVTFGRLHRLDDFLKLWDGPVKEIDGNKFEIKIEELPQVTILYTLRYPI